MCMVLKYDVSCMLSLSVWVWHTCFSSPWKNRIINNTTATHGSVGIGRVRARSGPSKEVGMLETEFM